VNYEDRARLVAELEGKGLLAKLQVELTWSRLLAIFWLVIWRFSAGLIAIFSFLDVLSRRLIAEGLVHAEAPANQLAMPLLVIGILSALIWGLVVIRMALTKHYKLTGFSLIVLAR
jgi:hypothetical protein